MIIYVPIFWENHDFVPANDAFCNELNKRFKHLAEDAWAVKWDKRLWINPPFHLYGEVVQKKSRIAQRPSLSYHYGIGNHGGRMFWP